MVEFFKSQELLHKAVQARALRNEIIASNIANIDTPFYQAKDIDFESVLQKEASKIYKTSPKPLKTTNPLHFNLEAKMQKTNPLHLNPAFLKENIGGTIFARDGHLARNDANSVDLDIETTELAKNATMINAIQSLIKKENALAKLIIDTSAKLG